MPNLKHQAIIQILRDDPQIVATLLGHIGFMVPSGSYPVIADSDLSHRSSRLLKELRADNVFLFPGMEETSAVVVEVQTTKPDDKRLRAWPCYVTSAHAVHQCKAYMLTIATSRSASNGSAGWIEIGQPGLRFKSFVVGGHLSLPAAGGPVFGPQRTMLNILAGRLNLSTHEARVFALACIAPAAPDVREEYANTMLKCSSKRIRQALEELMATTFKPTIIDAAHAEEARNALFTVLAARRIAVLRHARARINACTDLDQLRKWMASAATATTIDEVFAA